MNYTCNKQKVREKSRECHNHKPQPFPDPKRKRKPTNPNKHKPNKRTKSTEISSLFPKRGNRNTKRTEKHKNKMTHGKTYNKSPRRINHKATKSKTNTGTTALERSLEQISFGLPRKAYESSVLWKYILFVLRFNGPVNPVGSCRARSVYLTTFLLGSLSPLSG